MNNPLVSIIIPTYNRAHLLPIFSVASVLNQTYQNWELIIVDDGSTDETKNLCQELTSKDHRVKYIYQENKGQGAGRNNGIKNSQGDFILLLDSDDALLPDMVNNMVRIMINNDLDQIFCRRWVFNKEKGIFDVNVPNPSCVIFKKTIFNQLGYFDESNNLRGIEDADLFISWDINKKTKNITIKSFYTTEPLVIYLEHEAQETNHSDLEKLNKKTCAIIDKYKNNQNILPADISLKYKESANFYLLTGEIKKGRQYMIQSIKKKFNFQALMLLFLSIFGPSAYRKFVYSFKKFREKNLWKMRLEKAKTKYPNLYIEALKMVEKY